MRQFRNVFANRPSARLVFTGGSTGPEDSIVSRFRRQRRFGLVARRCSRPDLDPRRWQTYGRRLPT